MKRLLAVFVLLAVVVTLSPSQEYRRAYGKEFRRSGRAMPYFRDNSVTVMPYKNNDPVTVGILVDTMGVFGTDSLLVAFNYDTTAANTIPLLPNPVSGQPWEFLWDSFTNVQSVQIAGPHYYKYRLIIR